MRSLEHFSKPYCVLRRSPSSRAASTSPNDVLFAGQRNRLMMSTFRKSFDHKQDILCTLPKETLLALTPFPAIPEQLRMVQGMVQI